MFSIKNFWKKSTVTTDWTREDVKSLPVPHHIAIIMDGNGRWAKKRMMPRVAGHHEGMQVVKRITRSAVQLGVGVLTLYAFSTENWKRPQDEVDFLMELPGKFLTSFLPELMELNVRVEMIGIAEELPNHTLNAVRRAMEETKDNTGLVLNFALNYGSRAEMVSVMQQFAERVQAGELAVSDITEETFSAALMTAPYGDPELLIRTSGEQRVSNFLLWQVAYSEFWFTDDCWPDFSEQHLLNAIGDFQRRGRRFGGV